MPGPLGGTKCRSSEKRISDSCATWAHTFREQALAAKKQREVASVKSEEKSLQFGRTVAYAEVISAMQDYLRAFEIPFEEMSLQGFDPDAELL